MNLQKQSRQLRVLTFAKLIFLILLISHKTSVLGQTTHEGVFAGAFPCNGNVNDNLLISRSEPCEYMRWRLELLTNGSYALRVDYGEYLPNTLFFKNGGKQKNFEGKVTKGTVSIYGSSYRMLQLTSSALKKPIRFVVVDPNILHLADSTGQFVPGGESLSFILNRAQ
jgi:hypothetical protein